MISVIVLYSVMTRASEITVFSRIPNSNLRVNKEKLIVCSKSSKGRVVTAVRSARKVWGQHRKDLSSLNKEFEF